jgi:hypothetical protein
VDPIPFSLNDVRILRVLVSPVFCTWYSRMMSEEVNRQLSDRLTQRLAKLRERNESLHRDFETLKRIVEALHSKTRERMRADGREGEAEKTQHPDAAARSLEI